MQKSFIFTLLFILSFAVSAAAQTASPAKPKIIAKGVVNGAAVSLPKPAYPPAAQAVKASGEVSVQVTIDEEGNVISAEAKGGHPLLQQAAREAAREAKFKPTLLSGQPVKVTGIIIYNFVRSETPKEEVPIWMFGMIFSILQNADDSLVREMQIELDLKEMVTALAEDIPPEIADAKPLLEKLAAVKGLERRQIVGELVAVLKKASSDVEKREFEIGEDLALILLELVKHVRKTETSAPVDEAVMRTHLQKIKFSIESAGISPALVKKLKPVADFADNKNLSDFETMTKLHEAIAPLFEIFFDDNE